MFEATVVAHPGSHMTLEETILANLSAGTLKKPYITLATG